MRGLPGAGSAAKNCAVQLVERVRQVGLANHEGDVAAGRGLRHQRIGTSPTPCSTRPIRRGSVLQPLADDADDRHVVLGVHLRKLRQRLDNRRAAAADRRW